MIRNLKVGEKVIALSDPPAKNSQKRKKGQVYTIEAVAYCANCGTQVVNIGDDTPTAERMRCSCGGLTAQPGQIRYTQSKMFCAMDELDAGIKACEVEEDYELASVLFAEKMKQELNKKQ